MHALLEAAELCAELGHEHRARRPQPVARRRALLRHDYDVLGAGRGGRDQVARRRLVARQLVADVHVQAPVWVEGVWVERVLLHQETHREEHVVVRDTENWDIIRDGAELCFVGDVDIRGEKMQSIVRLLRTLPRPLTLHFDESNAKTKSAKKSAAMGKKVKIAAAENSSSDDDVLSEDDGETI